MTEIKLHITSKEGNILVGLAAPEFPLLALYSTFLILILSSLPFGSSTLH